jgi:hypothetical protein
MKPEWINKYDSISCLHALEHFGLGRYGDRLDPNGHETGFLKLLDMLKPGAGFISGFLLLEKRGLNLMRIVNFTPSI